MTGFRPRLSPVTARAWRARWDRQQDRLVPDRSRRFDRIASMLGGVLGPRFRALDLGCGTGSLSEHILAANLRARMVALDFDPVLLALGRTALGDLGGRLTWAEADLRERDWASRLPPGRYDGAVSSTALHWLTEAELSRTYAIVARRLRPGGLFLNSDHLAYDPRSVRLTRWDRRQRHRLRPAPSARSGETWAEWWRAALSDPRLADEAALHRLRFPRAHVRTPTPDLAGHVRLLRRAGFREVEVVWADGPARILAAVR